MTSDAGTALAPQAASWSASLCYPLPWTLPIRSPQFYFVSLVPIRASGPTLLHAMVTSPRLSQPRLWLWSAALTGLCQPSRRAQPRPHIPIPGGGWDRPSLRSASLRQLLANGHTGTGQLPRSSVAISGAHFPDLQLPYYPLLTPICPRMDWRAGLYFWSSLFHLLPTLC